MKSHLRTSLLALAIVVVAGIGLLFWQPSAPHYAGQSVHAWLRQLESDDFQTRDRATAAVVSLGAQSVPALVTRCARKTAHSNRKRSPGCASSPPGDSR